MAARTIPKREPVVGSLIGLLLFVGLLATPQVALADDGPLANAPPIMERILWREGRFEIAPRFSFTIGDTYEHNLFAGLSLNYFFLDWLGLGLDFDEGFSVDTDLHTQINRELRLKRDAVCPPAGLGAEALADCRAKLGITDSIGTSSIDRLLSLNVSFAPIRGKFMLFDRHVVHYDMHIGLAGVLGFIAGEGGIDNEISFGPGISIGARLIVDEWITVGLDVRDFLLEYHAATDQRGTELPKEYHNHVMISIGVGFVFPMVPERESSEASEAE